MTKFVADAMKPVKGKDNWGPKRRKKFNKWGKADKKHFDQNGPLHISPSVKEFESSQDSLQSVQSPSYKGENNWQYKRKQVLGIRRNPHKNHINPSMALHITSNSVKESESCPDKEESASIQSTSYENTDLKSDEATLKQSSTSSEPEIKNYKPKEKRPSEQEDFCPNWKKLKSMLEKEGKSRPKKPRMTVIKTEKKKVSNEIWFDDVDPSLLEEVSSPKTIDTSLLRSLSISYQKGDSLVTPDSFTGLTKAVGLDCEMVGGGFGKEENILARVSVVNFFGHVLYDKYVKTLERVTDYRTQISGVRPKDLKKGESFHIVQKEVGEILKNRIVVGHGLANDFKCLLFPHPKRLLRDSSKYEPFRELNKGKTPSLKLLSEKVLGVQIQSGEHSSIVDAQAAMRLYVLNQKKWDKSVYKTIGLTKSRNRPEKKKRPKNKKIKDDTIS